MIAIMQVRTAVLAGALGLALTLVACGGGGGSKLKFDPERADQIAHAALIKTSDLPGTGWTVAADDKFDEDVEPPAKTAACNEISAFQKENKKIDATDRAGRAKREFERRTSGSPVPASVDITIEVYREPKSLPDRLKKAKEFISRQVYQSCFQDALKDGLSSNSKSVTTRATQPVGKIPSSGFGFAVLAENITNLPVALRTEFYGWIHDNVALTLTALGTDSTLTPDVVNAAIEKTNAALDAAAKK